MRNGRHLKNPKIRDKCLAVSPPKRYCHTNKRQMYSSQSTQALLPYICLLFSNFSNVFHSACVWSTALKPGCITNFEMLFLVMGFISLLDEIMLIGNPQFFRSLIRNLSIEKIDWKLLRYFSCTLRDYELIKKIKQ